MRLGAPLLELANLCQWVGHCAHRSHSVVQQFLQGSAVAASAHSGADSVPNAEVVKVEVGVDQAGDQRVPGSIDDTCGPVR